MLNFCENSLYMRQMGLPMIIFAVQHKPDDSARKELY